MQTDGRTGMRKLTVAFRNFAKVPNKAVVAPTRTGTNFYCGPVI